MRLRIRITLSDRAWRVLLLLLRILAAACCGAGAVVAFSLLLTPAPIIRP